MNLIDYIDELSRSYSVENIIDKLYDKGLTPLTTYSLLRITHRQLEMSIRSKIMEIYKLDENFNFDNPLTNEFLESLP